MYEIAIRCERGAGFGSHCGWVAWTSTDLTADPPPPILQDMAERGWVERDGKHYCPRHDPDKVGRMVSASLEYVEIAPGVHVRWPGAHQEGDSVMIEVRRTGGT